MELKDPTGNKLGTVYSYLTIILVTGWVALKVMQFYLIHFKGSYFQTPPLVDELAGGLVVGYIGARKQQNASIAQKLASLVKPSDIQKLVDNSGDIKG